MHNFVFLKKVSVSILLYNLPVLDILKIDPNKHGFIGDIMKKLNLILAVLFLAFVWIMGLTYLSTPIITIVGGSMTVGFFFWLKYSYGKPTEPFALIPPFSIMLAALFIHIMEEYYMDFPQAISALFQVDFSKQTFLLVFEQLGPIVYFLVIAGLAVRNEFSNFFASFLVIGMGIAEVTHFIFPIIAGGPYHYFPGMYTAILPMITGIWTMTVVIKDSKRKALNSRSADYANHSNAQAA